MRYHAGNAVSEIARDMGTNRTRVERWVSKAPRRDAVAFGRGGYAMELRFHKARTTKDLDFTVRNRPAGAKDSVLALLQAVGAAEIGDWFSFRVGEATTDLDGAP